MARAGRHWRAMGTGCHALVLAPDDRTAHRLVGLAVETVAHLEGLWSRFRPESDISRINASSGRAVAVSAETILAVETALTARERTAGRFDPTGLPALRSAGYDRDFAEVLARSTAGALAPPRPVRAGLTVEVEAGAGTVRVAPGAGLDLGGVGKGLAADLATGAVLAAGATGACVNVGGDLRAAGDPSGPGGWRIAVDHPCRPGATVAEVVLATGGAATSSTRRRRWWTTGGHPVHHVIDPSTGAAAVTDVASVTVLAGTASDAEVDATAAIVAGAEDGLAELDSAGRPAVLVTMDGELRATVAAEAFLR